MAPESSITYYRDEEALTIIGNIMESQLTQAQTLSDINFKVQELKETIEGVNDDFLIKVVNGAITQTSFIETSVLNTSTSLQTYIPGNTLSVLGGSIETEIFNTIKQRMHLTTSGIAYNKGITITSDGRVGIGVIDPEEDFELDGNIQLDTGGVQRGRIIFYDKKNDHEHAEIDGLGEGTDGGVLAFYTKINSGSVTEKLRINNVGAIGIGGANYGSSGQVLTSNGSGSAVSWTTIGGQSTTVLDLSKDYTSSPTQEPIINFIDSQAGGTLAFIKMETDTLNTGRISFHTKNGSSLHEVCHMKSSDSVFRTNFGVEAPGSGGAITFTCGAGSSNTTTFRIRVGVIQGTVNYTTYSDDRLKSRTTPLINALDIINKVKTRNYQYHPGHMVDIGVEDTDLTGIYNERAVGVVAQELEEIPELSWLVKTDPSDDLKSVDYTGLNVYLLRAVQELSLKVSTLEEKLNSA